MASTYSDPSSYENTDWLSGNKSVSYTDTQGNTYNFILIVQ